MRLAWCTARSAAYAVLGRSQPAHALARSTAASPPPAIAQTSFATTAPVAAASHARWKARQAKDLYAREAKVRGLKSRAAFKLLEIDAKYRLFKPGQTVVDLGYAPGSWSQVAVERTKPDGLVLGIDLIPAQPPRGVSTIQGNFLAPSVREHVKQFLAAETARRPPRKPLPDDPDDPPDDASNTSNAITSAVARSSYLAMERHQTTTSTGDDDGTDAADAGHLVDVLLSDMSAPWPQTSGFWLNTLSLPYLASSRAFANTHTTGSAAASPLHRMMNTSGTPFRDHAGSMDLCLAALAFACDTLRPGGHLVCKFYQGNEERALEQRLRRLFERVTREKPESSRKESKEAYFVALKRKRDVTWEDVEAMKV